MFGVDILQTAPTKLLGFVRQDDTYEKPGVQVVDFIGSARLIDDLLSRVSGIPKIMIT